MAAITRAPRRGCAACSTSTGSRRIARVPTTTSGTPGARLRMAAPSCCATHPATATTGSRPVSAASIRSSPRRVYSFSSARSRTLHVLMTTTSASCASSVASKPACSRSPAIRSESWTFIWQPKVSIRYLRAMASRRGPGVGRQLSPFALSLSPLRGGRPGPSFKHLTRGAAETIGNYVPTQHPGELVDAPGLVEPADCGPGAPALDLFLDLEMAIGVGRDLRQVRDAENLERRSHRAHAAGDDLAH